MPQRLIVACLLAFAVACADESTTSPALAGTPFAALGVNLGTTASSLRAARPRARFEPYRGFGEEVAGFRVTYEFDASLVGADTIDDQAIMDRMMASHPLSGHDSTIALGLAIRDVSGALGAPSKCEVFTRPARGARAIWTNGLVRIEAATVDRVVVGSDTILPRLIYTAQLTERVSADAATLVDCRRIAG